MANPNLFNTTSIVGGNAAWTLGSSNATLMTVDADKIVKINSIHLAAYTGNSAIGFIKIVGLGAGAAGVTTVGADSSGQIVYERYVTGNAPYEYVPSNPIYMMEGDILQGYASTSSRLTLFVSYEVLDDA